MPQTPNTSHHHKKIKTHIHTKHNKNRMMQKYPRGGYQEHYYSEVVEEEYSVKDDCHRSSLQLKPPHHRDGHGSEAYNFQYSESRFEKEQHHANNSNAAKYEHYSGHSAHAGHHSPDKLLGGGGHGGYDSHNKFLGGGAHHHGGHDSHNKFLSGGAHHHGGHDSHNKFLSGGGHGGYGNPNKFPGGGHGSCHHQQQYSYEAKPLWNAKSICD